MKNSSQKLKYIIISREATVNKPWLLGLLVWVSTGFWFVIISVQLCFHKYTHFAESSLLVCSAFRKKNSNQPTHTPTQRPTCHMSSCRCEGGGPHTDDDFDETTFCPLHPSCYHLLCLPPPPQTIILLPLFLFFSLLRFHHRVSHQCDSLPRGFLTPRYLRALESSKASSHCFSPSFSPPKRQHTDSNVTPASPYSKLSIHTLPHPVSKVVSSALCS